MWTIWKIFDCEQFSIHRNISSVFQFWKMLQNSQLFQHMQKNIWNDHISFKIISRFFLKEHTFFLFLENFIFVRRIDSHIYLHTRSPAKSEKSPPILWLYKQVPLTQKWWAIRKQYASHIQFSSLKNSILPPA